MEAAGRFAAGASNVEVAKDLASIHRRGLEVTSDRGDAQTTRDITNQWHAYLRHLLQPGSATSDDLRDLLTSLHDVANNADTQPSTVHNTISGGVQHGPAIQSGRITGLTFHTHHSTDPV